MNSSIGVSLEHIKEFEGGYVNDPKDPGGCTNMGVTIATYRRYINSRGTCSDLRAIGWAEAEAVYRELYWNNVRCDDLPAGVDLVVFDHAVNAGPKRAAKMLQRLVGANQDGVVGPVTLDRVARAGNPAALIRRYTAARLRYYRSLTRLFSRFGRGWTRRANAAESRGIMLDQLAAKA